MIQVPAYAAAPETTGEYAGYGAPASPWEQAPADSYGVEADQNVDLAGAAAYESSAPPAPPPYTPPAYQTPPYQASVPPAYYAPPPVAPAAAYGTAYNPQAAAYAAKQAKRGGGNSPAKLIAIVVGVLLVIGVIVVAISVIGSKSAENEKKIVGRWKVMTYDGKSISSVAGGPVPDDFRMVWEFKADKTLVIAASGAGERVEVGRGTWDITFSTLKIEFPKGSEMAKDMGNTKGESQIIRLDAGRMTLKDRGFNGKTLDLSKE